MTKNISNLVEEPQKPVLSIDVLTHSSDGKIWQTLKYKIPGEKPVSTAEEEIIKELALIDFKRIGNQTYPYSIYQR